MITHSLEIVSVLMRANQSTRTVALGLNLKVCKTGWRLNQMKCSSQKRNKPMIMHRLLLIRQSMYSIMQIYFFSPRIYAFFFHINRDIVAEICVYCCLPASLICDRCFDYYCSTECQKNDWNRHRIICFPMP